MINTVLFDLDGTILDTNELIFRSFEYVWERKGINPITRAQLVPYMGAKLYDIFKETTGATDAGVEELIRIYREYNFAHHDELVKPFPYVAETMSHLHDNGIRMGVVTTKIRLTSELGLKHCDLDRFIETIVSLDDVIHAKPHPEPIITALRRMDVKASEVVMVGDSAGDLIAAHRAGVQSVAVGWSIKSKEELQRCNPNYWIHDMRDLPQLVGVAREGP